ncbi:hypothetical protein HYV30_02325 [Candidatus Kaiserbacteria bacterium]|nr:hypothetical protein [Candidatus Kaiserbacteria bacterium]
MLEEGLAKAGLNAKEAAIYLAALESGPSSILQLSRKTGIKRPTIYEMMPSLLRSGVIAQTAKGKRKQFVAEPPEKLFEAKRQELNSLRELLPTLEAFRNASIEKPDIKWFQGIENIQEILWDMVSNTSVKEQLLAIEGQFNSIYQKLGDEFFQKLLREKARRNLESLTISTMSPQELEKTVRDAPWSVGHQIEVRLIEDANNDFKLNFFIYQDKVTIISALQEVALVIENKILFNSLKLLFMTLWKTARETPYRIS